MVKIFNRYLPLRIFIFAGIDAIFLFSVIAFCLLAATGWGSLHFNNEILFVFTSSLLCLATMYFFDLYDLDRIWQKNDVIISAMRAIGVGALTLAPISLLFLHFGIQTWHLEVGLIFVLASVSLYRISYAHLASYVSPGERVILIGKSLIIDILAQRIRERNYFPFQLVAIMSATSNTTNSANSACRNAELDRLIASFRPSRIVIDSSSKEQLVPALHLLELRQQGICIDDAHVLYETMTARVPVAMLQVPNLAYGPSLSFTPNLAIFHYVFDFILASILLLLIWPLFILIAICIRLDSQGSIFYKQERVGLHNKNFNVIKFRSMRSDAETESGPIWAQQGDSRITQCGRVLRKLRLDELPQIWNVLRGDMSLVGPRPERPHFVGILREEIPFYDLRHSVRPGITGWAQICAPYGASISESLEKVEYDLFI